MTQNVTMGGGGGSKKCGKSVTYYLNGPKTSETKKTSEMGKRSETHKTSKMSHLPPLLQKLPAELLLQSFGSLQRCRADQRHNWLKGLQYPRSAIEQKPMTAKKTGTKVFG